MITKEKIIQTISELPEERFNNMENIIEELILLEKVEKGLEDLRNGDTISDEELDREVE